MMLIENESLRLGLDESGRIVSLSGKSGGMTELIDTPAEDFFYMTLADTSAKDTCKEILVWAHEQEVFASRTDTSADFRIERLKIDNGRDDAGWADISVTFHVTLDGENIIFNADIDNRTDLLITDFEYPRVGVIKSLGDGKPTLFWPDQPGKLYNNIGERLSSAWVHRENGSNQMKITYPGTGMMGTCALLDRSNSLFLSIHDPDFIAAELKVIGDPDNRGAITLTVDKNLCIRRGKFTTPPIQLKLYRGDWHHGAADYAAWMQTQRPKHEIPGWIREMTGYFLVINKQQFGYEMWPYDTLPRLYELAEAHGCDTLGLFGWYQTGHDNDYPDLEVSHTLGGEDALKAGIKAVQEAGGHVTLYYQGHLIDMSSDYFKNGVGQRVASKNIWGTYYAEYYSKSHKSDFLAQYSRKMFALACPACPEWRELMVEREKWIASFGADGTLYDQIGGMPPYICFDENHPHDGGNPARALTGGQRKLVDELQRGSKEINRDFAFLSEHITDLYSAHLDAVHGIGNMPGGRGDRANAIGSDGGIVIFPDFFRYCFPETIITLRNTNPFVEARAVNYAFTFGFPLEIEIRFRQDKVDVLADKYAEKRVYAAKVSALRRRYKDVLAYGRYIDTDGIENPTPTLFARGFASDRKLAVTLWNDSTEACTPEIRVDGRKLVSIETADGVVSRELTTLAPNAVAVAVYE
ncbi:MAG: hypothetical protein IJ493_10740 [Clostridia bacterium]|nr:hypothetical protein [Clostridia bacterium]